MDPTNWKIGYKYDGDYKDGKFHGKGTYISAGGTKYVGEWKEGKLIRRV